jgi:uncharacterized secreted protein with C-terminal beta-propeller domain
MQSVSGIGFRRKEAALFIAVVLGVAAATAVVSLSSFIGRALINGTAPEAVSEGLGTFQTYSALESFMATNAESAQRYSARGIELGGPEVIMGVLPFDQNGTAFIAALTTSAVSAPSFTGTNVQVQGVDEPDSVKTDGTHLFVATDDAVTIINAYPPNSTSILSTITFDNATTTVLGIETAQDRLLVFNQRYSNATSNVDLLLYDASNFTSPKLIGNMSIAGTYVAARLAQGYAYAIVQQPSYQFNGNGNATAVMPTVTENGVTTTLPPSSVYYTPNEDQISYYTMVVSMSMSTGVTQTVAVLTGPSSTVYVSTSSIYVVYTNYQEFYADGIPGDIYTGGVISAYDLQQGENSTVFRASYSNGTVTVEAVGSVPGTVLNQFSLDEYSGYFRVATSRFALIGGKYTRSDDVYVLNMNMSQVSALRNIAPGENIYAVSFVGEMGYVVTYEQVDPLFAISFANPASPVILSALKVTGYSDYLYPLWGGYLIGVGKETVQSSTGSFSYYLGLKLSLFKVFDNGTSVQVSKYLIGDRGTDSPVLSDHLAFTFDPALNVTVIPVLLAKVSGNQTYGPDSPPPFGDYVWQGVYVLKVTPEGFTLLGSVSQYPPGQNYGDSPNGGLQIDRSVIIGNYLYTISQSEVMISSLSSFSTVATVQLPG